MVRLRRSSPSGGVWGIQGLIIIHFLCENPDLTPSRRAAGFERSLAPRAPAILGESESDVTSTWETLLKAGVARLIRER